MLLSRLPGSTDNRQSLAQPCLCKLPSHCAAAGLQAPSTEWVLIKFWPLVSLSQKPEEMVQWWMRLWRSEGCTRLFWQCLDAVLLLGQRWALVGFALQTLLAVKPSWEPAQHTCLHYVTVYHHRNQHMQTNSTSLWKVAVSAHERPGPLSGPVQHSHGCPRSAAGAWVVLTQKHDHKARRLTVFFIFCSQCWGPCKPYLWC